MPPPSPLSKAIEIEAEYATARLPNYPDDPAIWVHPLHPARSLIIGTMKVAAPAGAIVVFGMDGQIRQTISGIDRPNNVDVEYGFVLHGRPVDIAIATERLQRQLRVFRIDPADGRLVDLGGVPVLADQPGEAGAPMGIALYRRARDGAIFAIVAPKEGPPEGYLWQYRLTDHGGKITATFVRRFGRFSARTVREENEIEAVVVDDPLGTCITPMKRMAFTSGTRIPIIRMPVRSWRTSHDQGTEGTARESPSMLLMTARVHRGYRPARRQ